MEPLAGYIKDCSRFDEMFDVNFWLLWRRKFPEGDEDYFRLQFYYPFIQMAWLELEGVRKINRVARA
jgi:hypothetical protein